MSRQKQLDRITSPECREAHALMEERLVNDDHLDAVQEAALRSHLAECSECADFNRISRHLDELPPVSTELESLRMVQGARALYFQRRKRRRVVLGWSAAASAAALLLTLYQVLFSADNANTNNGQKLATGERLRMLDSQVTLYSSAQTNLHTVFENQDALHVRLDDGFMCANIEPKPNHRVSFRVITPMGNVDIKGTVFGVTVSDDAAKVEVVRGEVTVQLTTSDRAFSAVAGTVFDMVARRTARIDASSDERIRALLDLPSVKTDASVGGETETATEGESPPSSSYRDIISPSTPPPTLSSPQGAPHFSRPSLTELLEEATQCRIDADWDCAAKRYKKIITTYPQQGEVGTALINLGQIQVKHLHKPLEARRNFEAYLKFRPSGVLSEQALYGIARANRSLDDRREEQRALERFLTLHPSSPMAGSARQRLEELKKNSRR